MMSDTDAYVSLMSGLPDPERLFLAKVPPLSRIKLDSRLKTLSDQDKDTLHKIETILDWRMQHSEHTDQFISQHARQIYTQLQSETLKTIVREKMELRTCIAGLRYRAHGHPSPDNIHWGFGRWVAHINRNWNEPNFALEQVFPWLADAQQLLAKEDADGLERFILEKAFKRLQRFSVKHFFDFEAVVIYVLEWNIIDRSARYNVEGAKRRFTKLIDESLTEFANSEFEEQT